MAVIAQQGPVGGAGGGALEAVDVQEAITRVTTWTEEGEDARMRGITFQFKEAAPQSFGQPQAPGTTEDDEIFTGTETFTRLDVFPTVAEGLGGRVAGFVLHWTDDGGEHQKQFGVAGNLVTAQFNIPGANTLAQILISSGIDIDSMGVAWQEGS